MVEIIDFYMDKKIKQIIDQALPTINNIGKVTEVKVVELSKNKVRIEIDVTRTDNTTEPA